MPCLPTVVADPHTHNVPKTLQVFPNDRLVIASPPPPPRGRSHEDFVPELPELENSYCVMAF
jgi:hypothetical protein